MLRAFTLLEMILVLGLLGIFGIFSTQLLLGIYQNYAQQNTNLQRQLEVQNALLQIKRILENSHLQSLQIAPNSSLPNALTSLKGKSLMFYPKLEEFALEGNFAIPCLHGIFNPKSWQPSNSTQRLEFLLLSRNPHCNIQDLISKDALIKSEHFTAPQDFYNPAFKGKITGLSAQYITLEIPQALQQITQIQPHLYFLDAPFVLSIGDSITLETQNSRRILVRDVVDFKLKAQVISDSFAIYATLCLGDLHCAEAQIVEL